LQETNTTPLLLPQPKVQTKPLNQVREERKSVTSVELNETPRGTSFDIKKTNPLQEEKKSVALVELNEKPKGPSFDVGLLMNLLDKATTEFVQHLELPLQEEGSQEMMNKDGFLIYSKEVPEGIMMKAQWLMPYAAKEFFEFLGNAEDRCRWDKSLESVSIIAKYPPDIVVTHSKFKKVPMISPRDVLLVSRVVKAHNGSIIINTSCEHGELEPTESFVRATVKLSGYYVETIPTDEAGNKSRVVYINIANFGGKVPKSIIKTTSAKHIPGFVKKVHSEIALIVGK